MGITITSDGTPVEMCDAATRGDLETVRRLLLAKPELATIPHPRHSRPNRGYRAPIHFAAEAGQTEVVGALLETGADPIGDFFHNFHVDCALTLARERGHDAAVAVIEDHLLGEIDRDPGALDRRDTNGNTLVHLAVYHRHVPLLRSLILCGAECDLPNERGQRPIHLALYDGLGGGGRPMLRDPHYPIAGMLLAAGASADVWTASALGDITTVRRALRSDAALAKWNNGAHRYPGGANYPLAIACHHGHLDVVRELLDHGADPDLENDNEYRESEQLESGVPLIFAIARGHFEIAHLLLDRGARADRTLIHSGPRVMDVALDSGNQEIVDRLVVLGARPLPGYYCSAGNYVMVRELLDRCADKAVEPGAGTFLEEFLVEGVRRADLNIVRMCLAKKPSLASGEGSWGRGSLSLLYHTARNLHDADVNHDAVIRVLRTLLAYGVDPKDRDRQGVTALHYLSPIHPGRRPDEIRLAEAAGLLLDHNADINPIEKEHGQTPLGWAVRFGRTGLVEFLLERGADPNLTQGEAPLAVACQAGFAEVEQILRNSGARPRD